MENDELLGRLDERFKALGEKLDYHHKEQKDKNLVIFDFINNKLALKEDLKHHVDNHWAWLTIFGSAIAVIAGIVELIRYKTQ